jgi:predicted permease
MLSDLLFRLRALVHRQSAERDLDEELQFHFERQVKKYLQRGLDRPEAVRRARLTFGGMEQLKEECRDARGVALLDTLLKDVRYGLRTLRKSPGFTIVAVLTLALGIGVNTTLFTAYDAIALKPLPVGGPDSVMRLERWFASGSLGNGQYAFSYPEYAFYRDHNAVFSSLVAASWPLRVFAALPNTGDPKSHRFRDPEKASAQLVSANYFSALGVPVLAGRSFLPEEDQPPGRHPVVVLSFPFWQRKFGSDIQVLGKIIKVNDTAFTVVGIAPPDFIGTGVPPQVPDFWAPLAMQEQVIPGQAWLNLAGAYQIQLLGRLRSGTDRRLAQAEAGVLASQFARVHPERDRTIDITLQRATFFGNTEDIQFQATVAGFMVVVGMVLLIACANLANMLLARSTLRRKEIGIRLALGASRARLIRQMLTESVLLSLMGGSAGLLLSIWASKLLWLVINPLLEGIFWSDAVLAIPTGPDVRVFGYTVLLSLLSGVIFGLSPALQCSKPDLTTALKEESNHRLSRSRLRGFLMGGQVAVSMLFLICAGLLVRGLLRSQSADPGFDTRSALMVWCDLGPGEATAHALQRQIVERLENLREIRGVTVAERFPFMGTWTPPIMPESSTGSSNGVVSRTLANHVSPSYFDTLGIPILRGRTFTRQEGETGARVGIISESGARRLWPGEDPLGRRAKLDTKFTGKFEAEFEVIGVAKDVRSANLSRVDPSFVYLPVTPAQSNGILVRTQGNRRDAIASVRTAIEAVDKGLLPGFSMTSLEEDPVRMQKLIMRTTTTFAAVLACLALALASVGIYGVMSYLVTQRTGEIGIRMALGANTRDVLASVVLSGLRPVFIGAVLGLVGAAGLSAILHATLVFPGSVDLLFGVSMFDPLTFIGLTVFVACVAALASAIPARRATSVDPVVALRYE